MAWRNTLRNKARSSITMASVFLAIFLSLITRSMQIGSYDNMINNVVGAFTGNIQVHKNGYWDEKIIDNVFSYNDSLVNYIESVDNVSAVAPRVETFALASYGNKTKGIMVNGVDPDAEDRFSKLKDKLIKGNYLDKDHDGILLGASLASNLKLSVGDSIVILGQGYHGSSAAGLYPVRGIVKFPSPDLDKRLMYMPIKYAQEYCSLDNQLTSLVIKLTDDKKNYKVKEQIIGKFDKEGIEVMDWRELAPELAQQIEADNGQGIIMLAILYLIVAFGIFGTLIMMINERVREFGVMLAIGMKHYKIAALVFFETLIIGFVGVVLGTLFSLPIIAYFHNNPYRYTGEMAMIMEQYGMEPIMPFAFEPGYFVSQAITVFIIIVLMLIIPVISIARLKTIKALRA